MKYKVPFRMVYCDTLVDWIRYTLWCHVVIKLWPNVFDLGADPLVGMYLEKPETFFEQYEFAIRRAKG